MCVHANPRFTIAERDDEIGSFPSDTFELKELVDLVGNFSRIVRDQCTADLANDLSLGAIETHRENRLFDFSCRELHHGFRRVGKGKKTMRGFCRSSVLRAQAQDAGDKHPERALVSFRHESDNRSFPFGNFPAQNTNDGMNVAVSHRCWSFLGRLAKLETFHITDP